MKILHRKITSATSVIKVPAPLSKYFYIIDDIELKELTGMDANEAFESSSAEGTPGYNVKHLAWVAPKAEYEEALADQGYGTLELLDEEGDIFIGNLVHDRIYNIDEAEIEDILSDYEG